MVAAARIRWWRRVWALVTALVVLGMIAIPAHAKQPPIELIGELDLKMPADTNTSYKPNYELMFDAANRTAYQVILMNDFSVVVRAWDLDKRAIRTERRFPYGELGAGPKVARSPDSAHYIHAIDPEGQMLYLMYRDQLAGEFGGIVGIDGVDLRVVKKFPRELVYTGVDPNNPGCTSSACQPQIPTANPDPKGMSFVPSVLSGGQPKLLILYQEVSPPFTERNMSLPYITQWGADTGRPDFVYRIQSCSSSALPFQNTEYQAALFQARLTSGIYLVCMLAGGAGAQVVRIDFDLNGRPSTEMSFAGPLSMTDAIADAEDDRIMIRVRNEEGESWWAFDGSNKSYTGVISATVRQDATANGIDPTSGRFYALVPTTGEGRFTRSGGLLVADSRRAPAPQALRFDQFAQGAFGIIGVDAEGARGERLVYARPTGATKYLIFRDNIPISQDPPDYEQDSLTEDVEEKRGVTDRNFAGSGHAFGARTVLVGGFNGMPPAGPDVSGIRLGRFLPPMVGSPCGPDNREIVAGTVRNVSLSKNLAAASSTVGGFDPATVQDVREPTGRCYPRPADESGNDVWERVVNAVRSVNPDLANQIQEYPRPFDTPIDGHPDPEGRSDADELLGTTSPFEPIECTGDSEAATTTKARPFDRGDNTVGPIPQDIRDRTVPLEDSTAFVKCELGKMRAEAAARIVADERDTPAFQDENPVLGTIRVAEASGYVTTYIDPKRGLVTKAVAVARGISIGDHLYIDTARTEAEAWAAGRPGTAATSFVRALCGVRTKDEAPDTKVYRPVVQPNENDPLNSKVEPQGGAEVEKAVDAEGCSATSPVAGQPSAIDVLNRVLGARGRAYAPEPDGPLSQGTPGGYMASVQRDRFEVISNESLNGDTSTQVPALEITLFNDDQIKGRGRQVYQFAGVDASVTYGIYLLNPDEDFFDPDGDDGLPDQLVDFTGGPTQPDSPPFVRGPEQPVGQRNHGPITILYEGVKILLRSPGQALLAGAVWLLLYSPVQLAGRRRVLRGLA